MGATKMVFVTGDSRGIGCETCRELVRMSHRVLLACRDHRKRELIDW